MEFLRVDLRREVKSLKSVVRVERKGRLRGGGRFRMEEWDGDEAGLGYVEERIWEYELGGDRESSVSGKKRSEVSSPMVDVVVLEWLGRGLLELTEKTGSYAEYAAGGAYAS